VLFPTIDFAIFFAVVFTVQWLLTPYAGAWKAFMVVASYVFYAWWDWRFIFLLAAATGIAYTGGRLVHPATPAWTSRPATGRAAGRSANVLTTRPADPSAGRVASPLRRLAHITGDSGVTR